MVPASATSALSPRAPRCAVPAHHPKTQRSGCPQASCSGPPTGLVPRPCAACAAACLCALSPPRPRHSTTCARLLPKYPGGRTTGTKKAGNAFPALRSPAQVTSLLVLAQEEQVQERQNSGQGSSYVGKGRRRQHPPGAARLASGEDAVAGQKTVGAGGGVDLHRQRHHVEGQHRQEQNRRELDKEKSGPARAAHKDARYK